jgi:hypothetical protein
VISCFAFWGQPLPQRRHHMRSITHLHPGVGVCINSGSHRVKMLPSLRNAVRLPARPHCIQINLLLPDTISQVPTIPYHLIPPTHASAVCCFVVYNLLTTPIHSYQRQCGTPRSTAAYSTLGIACTCGGSSLHIMHTVRGLGGVASASLLRLHAC